MTSIDTPGPRTPALWALTRDGLVLAVLGALAFQALHVAEHVIQIGAWFASPLSEPFLTPWANVGRDVLATSVGGGAAAGSELLHLLGNVIFFAGLVGATVVTHMERATGATRGLRVVQAALVWQGVHLAEHVLLTFTLWSTGDSIGLSTLFGAAMGQAWAGSLRVWMHFVLNAVPTILAAVWVARVGLALPIISRSRTESA